MREDGRLTKKSHRLLAVYREDDLWVEVSPRFTNADVFFIMETLNKEVLKELEARGYDLKTLRFQIDKTPAAIAAHEKRAGR